jgi:hypothetical protein
MSNEVLGRSLSASTRQAVARVAPGGSVNVAARAVGLILAGPEMQAK